MSNSCQNGGTDATGQLMVCTLKDFKVWRFCNHFAAAKHPSKWRLGCEMEDFQGMEVSQPLRSCETGVRACEMALMCQGTSSQLRKFSHRVLGGCETILQRESIFAAGHFWLRNFAGRAFSLLFELLLIPNFLISTLLTFLLILIIQKPILHQNKLK